jgi:hypothetical protein
MKFEDLLKGAKRPQPERNDEAAWFNVAWIGDRVVPWQDHEDFEQYVDGAPRGRILVAPSGTPAWGEALRKRLAPVLSRFGRDNVPDEAYLAASIYATAKTLLLDWESVDDKDGNPVPYTTAAGIDVLRAHEPLRDAVAAAASALEQERHAGLEADAEALEGNSSGASPTARGSRKKGGSTTSK